MLIGIIALIAVFVVAVICGAISLVAKNKDIGDTDIAYGIAQLSLIAAMFVSVFIGIALVCRLMGFAL